MSLINAKKLTENEIKIQEEKKANYTHIIETTTDEYERKNAIFMLDNTEKFLSELYELKETLSTLD